MKTLLAYALALTTLSCSQSDRAQSKLEEHTVKSIIAEATKQDSTLRADPIIGRLMAANAGSLEEISSDYTPDNDANQFLYSFGKPPVGSVHKYPVAGAETCVIEIKQMHTHPFFDNYALAQVNKNQKKIYEILSWLHQSYNINAVHPEGVIEQDQEEQFKGYLRKIKQYIGSTHMLNPELEREIDQIPTRSEFQAYLSTTNESDLKQFERIKYIPGGDLALQAEGKIDILCAEWAQLNDISMRIVGARLLMDLGEKGNPNLPIMRSLESKIVFEGREDVALAQIKDEMYPVIIFGAKHDFRNNIAAWNELYPDDKRSLIVITP